MSVLPINHTTIKYGSMDAGSTVHDEDEKIMAMMKQAASVLNLKGHHAGRYHASSAFLWSAADIEGHCGTDGRHYLCDFARSMPPEAPSPGGAKMAHLVHLLRPELVQDFDRPLCSDGFSSFTRLWPEEARRHCADIRLATKHLHEIAVPAAAKLIDEHMRSRPTKVDPAIVTRVIFLFYPSLDLETFFQKQKYLNFFFVLFSFLFFFFFFFIICLVGSFCWC